MIEDEKAEADILKFVMLSFVELMDHGTVSWDILQPSFIARNISFINNRTTYAKEVVQCALAVLENTVNNSTKYALIEKDVSFDRLLSLLQDPAPVIQQNTIALINALFQKADEPRKQAFSLAFCSKPYRNVLMTSVINSNIDRNRPKRI